jgi:hypothetical protein
MMNPRGPAGKRIWVVALNDLESMEIRKLLDACGELVLASAQPWGATWAGLEPEVVGALRNRKASDPATEVIGIELAGPNQFGAKNIDHHRYPGDDRSSALSSLEQVAAWLGVTLNRWQHLVAVNDRGYIPGMLAAGATEEEVARIRVLDRAAQGVSARDEQDAEDDICDRSEWRGDRVLVRCARRPTSAHSDRLFGRAREILLAGDGEWNYSGPRHRILAEMSFPEPHWSGGEPASGYFGIQNPGEESRGKLAAFFWLIFYTMMAQVAHFQ